MAEEEEEEDINRRAGALRRVQGQGGKHTVDSQPVRQVVPKHQNDPQKIS